MRTRLLACLLGIGLLLQSFAAPFEAKLMKRIVDCTLEGYSLVITSDAQSGTLKHVRIFNSSDVLVHEEDITGYYDAVDVSGLGSGTYEARVNATNTNYREFFTI